RPAPVRLAGRTEARCTGRPSRSRVCRPAASIGFDRCAGASRLVHKGVHPGVPADLTCAGTGGWTDGMQCVLDREVAVMDDDVVDAAHRILFAVVGQKQQEHPMLAQLREFLNEYAAARPVIAGEELPSLAESLGLVCGGAFGDSDSRRAALPAFALHDVYLDAVMRAGGLLQARVDLDVLFKSVP